MRFRSVNPRITSWVLLWLTGAFLYSLFLRVPTSQAYIDFGDGNYQYISWRLTQGIRLYTDILSPQPPFHLWVGATVERIASSTGIDALFLYRWVVHGFRLLTSLLIGGIAWRLFGKGSTSVSASLLFLLLPEGYRWSHGYQSENLELLLLTGGLFACLLPGRWGRHLGVVAAMGAVWTNMSALPFSLLIVLFSVRIQPVRYTPLLTAGATLSILLGGCLMLYGSAYTANVWSNQVASIPTDYRAWLAALRTEGNTIIELEGLFICLALLGMFLFLNEKRSEKKTGGCPHFKEERGWITLYGIFSVGSAGYVVKGGTVDYIFMLSEPMLALFSAYLLVRVFRVGSDTGIEEPHPKPPGTWLLPTCRILLLAGTIVLLGWTPLGFLRSFRYQAAPGVDLPDTHQGRIVEFSDTEARTILRILEELAPPGTPLWAPPYFAARTRHPIALDLSETYLWYVRWQQSVWGGKVDPAVEQMIARLTELIEKKALPLLLLNSRTGQWGQLIIPDLTLRLPTAEGSSRIVRIRDLDPRLERLQAALERNYHPLLRAPGGNERLYFQGMNERLEIWVPKDRTRYLPPWSRTGFSDRFNPGDPTTVR